MTVNFDFTKAEIARQVEMGILSEVPWRPMAIQFLWFGPRNGDFVDYLLKSF